jgi:hypothetical protein
MSLIPFDWNVIIRGFWNRAIFTPDKVSKNLFGLSEGTALQVLVPIDGMNSTKMIHNNILVSVNSGILEIATEKFEFPKIKECLDIGIKSLTWLKETPVFAGGYNIRYKLTDQNAVLIAEVIKSKIDDVLSDAGYNIKERSNVRSIEEGDGEINLVTQIDPQHNVSVTFNFNKNSTSIDEIIRWFSVTASDLESKTQILLGQIFPIKGDDQNDRK